MIDEPRDDRVTYYQTYYQLNKEKIKKRNAAWRKNNRSQALKLQRRWYAENKEHATAQQKEYRERTKDVRKVRDSAKHRLRKYGLDTAAVDAMKAAANNQCESCSSAFEVRGAFRMCVDHCHLTGKVRGLLCDRCNRTAGQFGDDPALLRRLADYLERHRSS